MFGNIAPKISAPVIQAIEDAIFFGHIKELDSLLDLVCEDTYFPDDLRYGLEALMYFRLHYGKGGVLEPTNETERQKVMATESSWGRDLIESIGHYPDMTEAKYA
jgi:hypothetical protein